MDDLSRFCCLNSACPEYGKRDAGNLTVTHRYGPERARRMLPCRACKGRFSERKGTPLFGPHLPPEKAVSILEGIESVSGGTAASATGTLGLAPIAGSSRSITGPTSTFGSSPFPSLRVFVRSTRDSLTRLIRSSLFNSIRL